MKKMYLIIMCIFLSMLLFSCRKTDNSNIGESNENSSSETNSFVNTTIETSSSVDNNHKFLLYKQVCKRGGGEFYCSYTYDYDSKGREIKKTYESAGGKKQITEQQYNNNGKKIKETDSTDGKIKSTKDYTYDEKGNLISENYYYDNKLFNTLTYIYDDKGRISKVESEGTTKIYTYDATGGYKISDNRNSPIETYNKDGLKIETISGDTRILNLYDNNSNLIETKDFNNGKLRSNDIISYNSSNKIEKQCSYENGKMTLTIIYNYNESGYLKSSIMTYANGVIDNIMEYEYKLYPIE